MIELSQLTKRFDDVTAVDSVDLHVARGETVCLIGTSGCGKSTTLKMINRLLEPSAGEIHVGGRDVMKLDPIRLRREIGYVIQSGGLFPHMTVRDNIGLVMKLEGKSAAEIDARTAELLDLVRLQRDFAGRYPRELSGGQQQRVGIARALALDPEVILMDEPFGALDPLTRIEIQREFQALKDAVKKTVVLVTHDLDEAFALGNRVAIMDAGRVVQVGSREDLMERPASDFVARFVAGHTRGVA